MKQTHKWMLEVTESGQKSFDLLPTGRIRLAAFQAIRELLVAENPYSVPGVKKLLDTKFEGMRRQETGDFRIVFFIESGEIEHLKQKYKGKFYLVAVFRRNEKTYR